MIFYRTGQSWFPRKLDSLAIKAMVSRPDYNPNLFVNGISTKDWNAINNDPNYPLNNKVISGEYPPGSTFKIVTGSAAFELNKVKLDELIYDGGFHPLVPTMGNAGGEVLGWLSFIKGLAMSDNAVCVPGERSFQFRG